MAYDYTEEIKCMADALRLLAIHNQTQGGAFTEPEGEAMFHKLNDLRENGRFTLVTTVSQEKAQLLADEISNLYNDRDYSFKKFCFKINDIFDQNEIPYVISELRRVFEYGFFNMFIDEYNWYNKTKYSHKEES